MFFFVLFSYSVNEMFWAILISSSKFLLIYFLIWELVLIFFSSKHLSSLCGALAGHGHDVCPHAAAASDANWCLVLNSWCCKRHRSFCLAAVNHCFRIVGALLFPLTCVHVGAWLCLSVRSGSSSCREKIEEDAKDEPCGWQMNLWIWSPKYRDRWTHAEWLQGELSFTLFFPSFITQVHTSESAVALIWFFFHGS